MKKYFLLILMVVSLCFIPTVKATELPEVTDHEKVKVYFFHGYSCPHCQDFLEYFINHYEEYEDYFEVICYETWKNTGNQSFMLEVKKYFGDEEKASVPYFVVGDDYTTVGYASDDSTADEIIAAALKAYQDDDYTDAVAKLAKKTDEEIEAKSFIETATEEEIGEEDDTDTTTDTTQEEDEDHSNDTLAIVIIALFLVAGFGALVFVSRKKK